MPRPGLEEEMAVYGILDIEIRDMERYREYMRRAESLVEAAGGRYLVRGGPHKIVEGGWFPRRLVILEFPTMDALEDFYLSPDYQSLKILRQQSSITHGAVAVEGMEGMEGMEA
jgi:uncharacterized protein (DUF1330 family)